VYATIIYSQVGQTPSVYQEPSGGALSMGTYADPRQIRVSRAVCEQAQVLAVLDLDGDIETILVGILEEVVDLVKVACSVPLNQSCR
jgi:hypothetical protein